MANVINKYEIIIISIINNINNGNINNESAKINENRKLWRRNVWHRLMANVANNVVSYMKANVS